MSPCNNKCLLSQTWFYECSGHHAARFWILRSISFRIRMTQGESKTPLSICHVERPLQRADHWRDISFDLIGAYGTRWLADASKMVDKVRGHQTARFWMFRYAYMLPLNMT